MLTSVSYMPNSSRSLLYHLELEGDVNVNLLCYYNLLICFYLLLFQVMRLVKFHQDLWLSVMHKYLCTLLNQSRNIQQNSSFSNTWSNNLGVVALASKSMFHAHVKHIEIDVHFIREQVLYKTPEICHVALVHQIVNCLTKLLPTYQFQFLCDNSGFVLHFHLF